MSTQDRPDIAQDKDTRFVRAIHGCHLFDDVCRRLVRLPALPGPASREITSPSPVAMKHALSAAYRFSGSTQPMPVFGSQTNIIELRLPVALMGSVRRPVHVIMIGAGISIPAKHGAALFSARPSHARTIESQQRANSKE
ncbi:hypothetical protein ACFS5L_25710 [Streptomyces phyllanthi]|uniref:Uncharacterized protein n=1 Tax=Streptomyces phyllanthi TaxID=1803180 RepID=A0A5N8W5F7_9ACTN|nr:hypothetical protein [Streptomyces phyllanthi]MPY41578.1 hypothetical protein [Streptomyces phyllanthi]